MVCRWVLVQPGASLTAESDSLAVLQVITLDHDKYERELRNIADSHKKSVQVGQTLLPPLCAEPECSTFLHSVSSTY